VEIPLKQETIKQPAVRAKKLIKLEK